MLVRKEAKTLCPDRRGGGVLAASTLAQGQSIREARCTRPRMRTGFIDNVSGGRPTRLPPPGGVGKSSHLHLKERGKLVLHHRFHYQTRGPVCAPRFISRG